MKKIIQSLSVEKLVMQREKKIARLNITERPVQQTINYSENGVDLDG